MAIAKYICKCGNKTDILTSYFIDGIRVTACEKCDEEFKIKSNALPLDYEEVKKDLSKQIIDTREK